MSQSILFHKHLGVLNLPKLLWNGAWCCTICMLLVYYYTTTYVVQEEL